MKNTLRVVLFLVCLTAIYGCLPGAALKEEKGLPGSPSSVYLPPSAPLKAPKKQAAEGVSIEGKKLSLGQCIDIALRESPALRASWSRIKEAMAGVQAARSAYLPGIDLSAGASRSKTVQNGMEVTSSSIDTGISLRYLIFDGGRRQAAVQASRAKAIQSGLRHNATLLETALKVERAYYQVIAAEETAKVAEQTLKQSRYHVELARARFENGMVTKADLLRAETERADATLQLVRARALRRLSLGRLAAAMGLRPTASFDVVGLPEQEYKQQLAEIDRLMKEALRQRPELQAALAGISATEAELKKAEARYWPEITLRTDYGWQDSALPPDREHWFTGIGLSFPLFDGFNREAEIRRAGASVEEAKAGYEDLLHGVELEVWDAYTKLIEATQAVEAARALFESASESARVTEGEYKNGAVSIVDVIDAQTALNRAGLRLVQAKLDWHTAMAELERAVGRLITPELGDKK